MNNTTIRHMQGFVLAAAMAFSAPHTLAQQNQQPNAAPAQAAAPAAQNSFCGNRPLCFESTDFAATITEFRTSVDGYGNKILDAIVHFQNKTNQPLSLGYTDTSGSALDDRGNRFIINTYGGGVRGMGVVAGNNMDPKFMLQAGGGGDARFELYWTPRGAIAGVSYEMELSIREINRVEGNQWVLGGETLLHYQGLANGAGVAPVASAGSPVGSSAGSSGISSFVPSQTPLSAASTQPGCPPSATSTAIAGAANSAGGQNANTQSAISNAQAAIANLGSLFGHKKAAPTTTTAANPCAPAIAGTSSSSPTAAPVGYAVTPQYGSSPAPVTTTSPTAVTQRATTAPVAKVAVAQRTATPVAKPAVAQQPPAPLTKAAAIKPLPPATTAKTPAKPSPATPKATAQ